MVTTMTPTPAARAGEPFGVMLRGAFLPTVGLGLVTVLALAVTRGLAAGGSALLGLAVAIAFFASGLAVMARVVRDANPVLFMAVALSVYLGQVIALLLVMVLAERIAGLDDTAVGVTVLVVALAWQVFQMRAWRRARTHVFDDGGPGAASGPPGHDASGDGR